MRPSPGPRAPRRTRTTHATLKAHQSKKGRAWRIGYKAHIGVDAGSGLVHAVETTAANVSDISQAHALVREDDRFCYADFRL